MIVAGVLLIQYLSLTDKYVQMETMKTDPQNPVKASEEVCNVNSRKYFFVARICGLAALIMGGAVLIGWTFNISALVRLSGGDIPMVVNTAIGFVLGGLALIGGTLNRRTGITVLPALLGLSIVVLGAVALCESISGFSSSLGVIAKHHKFDAAYLQTGQIAPNTMLAFLCCGLTLILYQRVKGSMMAALVRIPTLIVFLLGLLGAVGYWMNLDILYTWADAESMALSTAIGIMILGVGLWQLWRGQPWNQGPPKDAEVQRIYRLSKGILIGTTIIGGIVSVTLLQRRVATITARNISRLSENHRQFFDRVLLERTARAAVMANEPGMLSTLQALKNHPNNAAALQELRRSVEQLPQMGFSSVAYTIGTRQYQALGQLIPHPALQIPLKGSRNTWLIWSHGYILRTRIALKIDGNTYGDVTAEQPIHVLDHLYHDASNWGKTGTMVVCSKLHDQIYCFPVRNRPHPFHVPTRLNGHLLPTALSLRDNHGGIVQTADGRGLRVLAAYGPIGHTGLGLVMKMDMSEVYTPIREQFYITLPIIVGLILVGLWATRRRLKPLIQALVSSREQAQTNEARFIAATNGSLDAFFILESVRNKAGEIQDFRFVFANLNIRNITRYTAEELKGQLLCELFPICLTNGFFEQYKSVVETGQTLAQEFENHDPAIKSTWGSQQVVRLGDGVAITARDITEKKKAEREIHEIIRLRNAIFNSAEFSIIATDVNGSIITINKAAQRMLGYSQEDMTNNGSTMELIHDPTEILEYATELTEDLGRRIDPGFEVFVAKARLGTADEREWTYIRKDGTKFPVRLSITALCDTTGEIVGFLGVAYDITEQKRSAAQIKHQALHDPLTGLANRALLEDRVKSALAGAKRRKDKVIIALMDLDNFKPINDVLGHGAGDKLLQTIARRLETAIRDSDTVARIGGDEFVLVLSDVKDTEMARSIVQRAADAVSAPVYLNEKPLRVTPSIGISVYPDDGTDIQTLLKKSDMAMYRAKKGGRSRCEVFDAGISDQNEITNSRDPTVGMLSDGI